jgi:tetratricopeptide (TPR) repeat protein
MAAKPAKSIPAAPPDPWLAVMPGLLLLFVVIVAYLPALRGQFIWDDDFHVTKCEPLRSLAGLGQIWFQPGATQQFYPLTWTSFWFDYHLWGLHPFMFHAENILLHGVNAILVWRILRRLNVPGAWLGAALFALHPVGVESVAWISERKNTLSGLFSLLCVLAALEFWLPHRAASQEKSEATPNHGTTFGPWKFYWLTLAFFLFAIWSKTVTAGLPGIILLLVWWKRGRWVLKDWLLVLPFIALGLAMGLVTAHIEHRFVLESADAAEWKLSPPEKFIIAGKAFWFYLGKLIWPYPLVFIYPRWILQPSQPLAYLPLAAAVMFAAFLWWKRSSWGRSVLTAIGCFVVALLPALGFFNIFPFRYSFVADHFQYLAAIAPIALGAAGLTFLLARLKNPDMARAIAGAMLVLLAVLTWFQTGVYKNREVLWRHTLAHNPTCWMAHDNLGLYLTEAGRFSEAEEHYRKAIEIRPSDHLAYYDLGLQAAIRGNLPDAADNFNKTLELAPRFTMAHYQVANVYAREGNLDQAILEYHTALKAMPDLAMAHLNLANVLAQNGNTDGAMEEYNHLLEKQPDYAPAHVALGKILSSKGDFDGAIDQYRAALALEPDLVEAITNLGNMLVAKGSLDEAVTYYRSALQLDPNNPVIHLNLSVALTKQGNTAEAQAERNEARRLETQHPPRR